MEIFDPEEAYQREKREDHERWERYQRTGAAISHEQARVAKAAGTGPGGAVPQ